MILSGIMWENREKGKQILAFSFLTMMAFVWPGVKSGEWLGSEERKGGGLPRKRSLHY